MTNPRVNRNQHDRDSEAQMELEIMRRVWVENLFSLEFNYRSSHEGNKMPHN